MGNLGANSNSQSNTYSLISRVVSKGKEISQKVKTGAKSYFEQWKPTEVKAAEEQARVSAGMKPRGEYVQLPTQALKREDVPTATTAAGVAAQFTQKETEEQLRRESERGAYQEIQRQAIAGRTLTAPRPLTVAELAEIKAGQKRVGIAFGAGAATGGALTYAGAAGAAIAAGAIGLEAGRFGYKYGYPAAKYRTTEPLKKYYSEELGSPETLAFIGGAGLGAATVSIATTPKKSFARIEERGLADKRTGMGRYEAEIYTKRPYTRKIHITEAKGKYAVTKPESSRVDLKTGLIYEEGGLISGKTYSYTVSKKGLSKTVVSKIKTGEFADVFLTTPKGENIPARLTKTSEGLKIISYEPVTKISDVTFVTDAIGTYHPSVKAKVKTTLESDLGVYQRDTGFTGMAKAEKGLDVLISGTSKEVVIGKKPTPPKTPKTPQFMEPADITHTPFSKHFPELRPPKIKPLLPEPETKIIAGRILEDIFPKHATLIKPYTPKVAPLVKPAKVTTPKLLFETEGKQRQRLEKESDLIERDIVGQDTATTPTPALDLEQVLAPRVTPKVVAPPMPPITPPKLEIPPYPPKVPTELRPPAVPTLPPIPPLPLGLPFATLGGISKKEASMLGRQPKKYQPSLEAIFFGIRGKKPKKLTGLELRPLPLKKKKRKKRISPFEKFIGA